MKKFFFSYLLLLMVTVSLGAQNFIMKSMKAKAPAEVAEVQTWMFNYNANYEMISGFGAGVEAEFGGWVGYNTDKLSEYNGRTITGVKIYVNDDMDNASIWIRKGNETVDKAEGVAQTQANLKGGTWSYVKFETPVTIDASTKYYIGYQAKVSASDRSVAGDCTKLTVNDKGMSGVYYNDGKQVLNIDLTDNQDYMGIGHLLVAALIDGNLDEYLPAVNMQYVAFGNDVYLENGSKIVIPVKIDNAGYDEINSFEVSYMVNGEEQTISSEASLKPYTSVVVNMPELTVESRKSVSVKLSKVNGVAVENPNLFNFTYRGYDSDKLVDRNALLLEKFTGQSCGFCPAGETSIISAIKGFENQIARISHHYGYMEDIFTIDESAYTGYFLQVLGAPFLAVNRTCYPEMAEQMKTPGMIPFNPGYLESSFIKNELAKKTFTTIEATDSYDDATREYTVTVKGKGIFDMKGLFGTVANIRGLFL